MTSSRSAVRVPRSVRSGSTKFVALLIAAGILVWIVNDAAGAAHVFTTVVDGLTTFFRTLRV